MALFDKKAVDYDDWCKTQAGHFVDSLEKKLMKETAKPLKGEKGLDLGCGTGIYSFWLLELGLSVTGIDLSSEMLKAAKAKKDSKKIKFVQGNIDSMPFPNETFDLIVSNIVLEFTNHPKQVVHEAMRVLKHGGRFVCGLIGKESSWGKMYEEHGKQDSTSVFSEANFLSLDDINGLYHCPPVEITYGLYVGLKECNDLHQARLLEDERKKLNSKEEAGYMVVKWVKK